MQILPNSSWKLGSQHRIGLFAAFLVLVVASCSGRTPEFPTYPGTDASVETSMPGSDLGRPPDDASAPLPDTATDTAADNTVEPDQSVPEIICEGKDCPCAPECEGKECGPDGCGGECGQCRQGQCESGTCPPCTPECEMKDCGPDGCGDSCGHCADGEKCTYGKCQCQPLCDEATCGPDACGGQCGFCPEFWDCVDGGCFCESDCTGAVCGNDGCGGSCGECTTGDHCVAGACVCDPQCGDRECGADACGGQCGTCPCPGCGPEELVCNGSGYCEPQPGLTCFEVYDCTANCGAFDTGCRQSCLNQGAPFAQTAYNAFMGCLINVGYANCANLPEPAQTNCYVEKQQLCLSEMVTCLHGDLTCVEMWLCLLECPSGNSGCQQDCQLEGNVQTQYLWNDFVSCLTTNGYWECPDDDLACKKVPWGTCEAKFAACVAGTQTCGGILDCLDMCAPSELICQSGCIYVGTNEAQALYQAILDCAFETCGPSPTWECYDGAITNECAVSYISCLDD